MRDFFDFLKSSYVAESITKKGALLPATWAFLSFLGFLASVATFMRESSYTPEACGNLVRSDF